MLLLLSGRDYKEHILQECEYWKKCARLDNNLCGFTLWTWLLVYMKEYRNLALYRLSQSEIKKAAARAAFIFLPKESTLYLNSESIGWNLYIQHGFATVLTAQSVGENCWINQQVTVGYSFDDKPPVIGNGVRICAGAKVIGNITIGDNAIIGANSVACKNISENIIAAGVPARKIGINTEHRLF